MIAPLHLLGLAGKTFPCGCGKDWGCVEAYTTISGLPYLLAEKLLKYPTTNSSNPPRRSRKKFFRSAAARRKATVLALEIFDFQGARDGLAHVANLAMALDPGVVVIGRRLDGS